MSLAPLIRQHSALILGCLGAVGVLAVIVGLILFIGGGSADEGEPRAAGSGAPKPSGSSTLTATPTAPPPPTAPPAPPAATSGATPRPLPTTGY